MSGGTPTHLDHSCVVPGCGRPAPHANLCRTCSDTLLADLRALIRHPGVDQRGVPLPGLVADLITTLSRSDRVGHASVGVITRTPTPQLPFAEHAADALSVLRGVLSSWIRDLWETYAPRGPEWYPIADVALADGQAAVIEQATYAIAPGTVVAIPDADVQVWTTEDGTVTVQLRRIHDPHRPQGAAPTLTCGDSLEDMAAWLTRHPSWMTGHPAAAELYDEITAAVARAQRVVDRRADRRFAGACGAVIENVTCVEYLFAHLDQPFIRCPTCGSLWDVDERRRYLIGYAEARVPMTAAEIAEHLSGAGVTVTAAAIRAYKARDRIHAVGKDHRGNPTYYIQDVRTALADRYKHLHPRAAG